MLRKIIQWLKRERGAELKRGGRSFEIESDPIYTIYTKKSMQHRLASIVAGLFRRLKVESDPIGRAIDPTYAVPIFLTPIKWCVVFVAILNMLLFSNISFASQLRESEPHKEKLDLLAQKKIDSIDEIRRPRILLAIPYLEHLTRPTEEDFRRDACKFSTKGEDVGTKLRDAIAQSSPLAYKKSLDWTGAIIGIDYFDSKENPHVLLFDQDYSSEDRVNGYFDGQPITAKSSLVPAIYRIVAELNIHNSCDIFINSYRK